MQLILIKEQEGLGKIGDAVNVADGYARNFLLPRKIAIAATQAGLDRIAKLKKEQEALEKTRLQEIQAVAQKIAGLTVSIAAKTGEEDKLYGSVTSADIEEALKKEGISVDKKKIVLEDPIRKTGEYTVQIKLHPEANATLKVQVLKE